MTRIMVFGTFDGLHPGHEHFFAQARQLGSEPVLIVSIARDRNVKRIKGRLPLHPERTRAQILKKHPLVDDVVLGNVSGYLSHILRTRPQIIALGYDQTHYVKDLAKALQDRGLKVKVVRLQPYKPHLYKSSLLNFKRSKKIQDTYTTNNSKQT